MLAEIIPEGYDIYGKKILKPRPQKMKCGRGKCRVFRPTFPMGRFVSKPLKITCTDIQDIRQFLQGCSYVSDLEQFQQADYWLPPEEFEHTRMGDCEDFALWTWRQLMAMGFSARFVVGRAGQYGNGHAWVTFEHNGRHFLVESLACWYGDTFPRLSMLRYRPEISVEWDGKIMHYFAHTQRSYTPSFREGFSLWGEWGAYKLRTYSLWVRRRATLKGITRLGRLFLRFWIACVFVILRMLPWKTGKYHGLRYLASRAVHRGKPLEIFLLTSELLRFAKKYPGHRYHGNAIHHGNILLGKSALLFGQPDAAKDHLIQAGKILASSPLTDDMPDISLAKALLERGEKTVVLEYFKLCRKSGHDEKGRLEQWANLIKKGEIPDFDTKRV
jgi:hypothetical protein